MSNITYTVVVEDWRPAAEGGHPKLLHEKIFNSLELAKQYQRDLDGVWEGLDYMHTDIVVHNPDKED